MQTSITSNLAVWQNIEERVLAFMAEVRIERLAKKRKKTLDERFKMLEKVVRNTIPKFSRITPSALEIGICIPEVLEILESSEDEFDLENLEKLVETALSEYTDKRLADARRYLENLIKQHIDLDDSANPLSLAVGSLFSCNYCNGQQSFPDVLGHFCSRRRVILEGKTGEFASHANRYIYPGPVSRIWSQTAFRSEAKKLVVFVRAYGLDPRTATVGEMDASEVRLVCSEHTAGRVGLPILTWRSAVRHSVLLVT